MDNEWKEDQKVPKYEAYEFRIKGHLSSRVAQWFEGMTISCQPDGTTIIFGPLPDQTALHSVLVRIRNMNLKLISVNPVIEYRELDRDQTKRDG